MLEILFSIRELKENITLNTRFNQSVSADILEMDSNSVKCSEVRISCYTTDVILRFYNILKCSVTTSCQPWACRGFDKVKS